ncbi:GNAT family N-acetyltransferase [Peribacillus deserti]|uniref:N-acetyltransferase n=1 Tax=Peribacillus deserti TaxID=673318 RepID=A0A2N5M7Y7_9BACI|nr:GNAT family N-acetyltransferase [Peribacillus deserti]PLT30484.1 N-acetyltransferase [Peribacillus deserti]
MEVKLIRSEDTFSIRHKVLRPNQTIEECKFPNDEAEHTFHLGVFLDNELISIASFYKEKHAGLNDPHQFRLRGMATLPEYRNRQAGSLLIKTAEQVLHNKDADVWWCNARTSASGYYKKLGLKERGGLFEIPGIGPHIVMYKRLADN